MSDKIIALIKQLTGVAEEYGAVSVTSNDKPRLQYLEDNYQAIMNDIRKYLAPSRTQKMPLHFSTINQQIHHAKSDMYDYLFGDDSQTKPEEKSIEIEFSL